MELRLPAGGLFAQEETDIEMRVSDTSHDAPFGKAPFLVGASISARLLMPAMPGMSMQAPKTRAKDTAGAYSLVFLFPHGGDYQAAVTITPSGEKSFTVSFALSVRNARNAKTTGGTGMDKPGDMHDMAGMAGMSGMMDMKGMMPALAGVGMNQEASGTSWMPAASPMYGVMQQSGRWSLMTHYNVLLSYDRQEGPRGDYQYNSTNWAMLMAERPVGKDRLQLRTMLTLEPLTVTPGGYPLLFQSGEQYHGKPLVDRQHPHDLFMELAARYTHPLGKDSAAFVYAAPSGEPALGPTAFMHRLSALDNPLAPITHHWQDSTHIEFGVLTAGAWKRNVQIEGSYFTGREPDEYRYDFGPYHPDSFSGRVTYNPGPNWSLQTSYGYIHSPEALRPTEDVRRTTASAQYALPLRRGGFWAATFGYGNNSTGGVNSDSYLLESELNLANRNTLFGRFEYVNKLGEELALAPADRKFGIGQFTLGYVRDVTPNRAYQAGIGAAVTFYTFPSELDSGYGKSPMGFWLFLRVRPAQMRHTM